MVRVEASKTPADSKIMLAASTLLLMSPAIPWAVEPGPGDDRLSLEARITRPIVEPPDTDVTLCVETVNRRTSGGKALVPGDT